jgi:hypothetical protein
MKRQLLAGVAAPKTVEIPLVAAHMAVEWVPLHVGEHIM